MPETLPVVFFDQVRVESAIFGNHGEQLAEVGALVKKFSHRATA